MKSATAILSVTTIILAIVVNAAGANDKKGKTAFSSYKIVKINNYPILLDPQLKYNIIKNEADNETFAWYYGGGTIGITCGKYIIDVGFTHGPSDDPSYYVVVTDGSSRYEKNINADGLAISSACQFYTNGSSNQSFDMRRKYTIANGIQETKQPFYLVDMTCSTSAVATLTTEPCGKGSIVATLPKGSDVRVLVSEWFQSDENDQKVSSCALGKESYLISTPFGLVGWVENETGDIHRKRGSPLSCIVFNGD